MLIRPINLAIVAVSQFMVFMLMDKLTIDTASSLLNGQERILIIVATVLIGAAGNIHNDILDFETDRLHKKRKLPLEKISRKLAWSIVYLFSFLGASSLIWVAWENHQLFVSGVGLACIALLWLYNSYLKHQLLVGNIAVGLLVSLVILLPFFYEPWEIRMQVYHLSDPMNFNHPDLAILCFSVLGPFTLLAFLSTVFRELVKDAEDLSGDLVAGSRTLPSVLNPSSLKILLLSLLLLQIVVSVLSYFYLRELNQFPQHMLFAGIIAFYLGLIWWLNANYEMPSRSIQNDMENVESDKRKSDLFWQSLSNLAKLIQVAGLCWLFSYAF
jgi:4-hydroxybenzoate polyprenyltransferase